MEKRNQFDPNKLSETTPLTLKQAGCINALTGVWLNHKAGVSMRRASLWISALKADPITKATAMAEIRAWKGALLAREQGKTPPGLTENPTAAIAALVDQPKPNKTAEVIALLNRQIADSVRNDRELAQMGEARRVVLNGTPPQPVRFDPVSAVMTPVVAKTPAVGVTVGQQTAERREADQNTTENARLSLLERKRRAMEALAN